MAAAAEKPIVVEGVSKRYQLGTSHEGALAERIESIVRAPLRFLGGKPAPEPHAERKGEFWALRDVSLEVERGQVLGLVGANGAGKSTLLKLLSRITVPTEGRIVMRGRLGSLLEVGTGFHPELTGRDNVYLNGAILGMRRAEIDARFDEIVEFSGISEFIDTPVKRYSSGMYVRLAFSVAAHLRTEILLVDEVLSVGDTEFQRKSLGKMDDASAEGRTVVFVSHNLSSVQRLCDRALWIDGGRVVASGPSQGVIAQYLKKIGPEQIGGAAVIAENAVRQGDGPARLVRISLLAADGRPIERVQMGERLRLSLELDVDRKIPAAVLELGLSSSEGIRVATFHNTDHGGRPVELRRGRYEVGVELDAELLPGDFTVDFGLHSPGGLTYDFIERVLSVQVVNPSEGERYPWATVRGSVRAASEWEVSPAGSEVIRATSAR